MSKTIRVAWLSRHGMTREQYDALEKIVRSQYGKDCSVSVENVGVHWQSSSDVWKDVEHNVDLWYDILKANDCITGIFPPIAEEALRRVPGFTGDDSYDDDSYDEDIEDEDIEDEDCEDEDCEFSNKLVMTPVTTRVVKNGKIDIVFHRWIKL